MSLNYRAFQPGLSPCVMAYSQPALWSRLLFLIAGFKNNCSAPFKKRQLDNDLVQKAYLSVTELGDERDLFAYQVTSVIVIISMCWRDWQCTQGWEPCGCPSPAVLAQAPGTGEPCSGMPRAGGSGAAWAAELNGGCGQWQTWEVMPCGAVLGRGIPEDALLKSLQKNDEKAGESSPQLCECCGGFSGLLFNSSVLSVRNDCSLDLM